MAQGLNNILHDLILPFEKRIVLKDPLGELLTGEPEDTVKALKKILEAKNPPMFASVGDFVTWNILNGGLNPDIAVVDHRVMREEVEPMQFSREVVDVRNPQGTISSQSYEILQNAVTLKKRLGVVVEGEEDLLVLPLMAIMPCSSIIVYGQPHEGMVVVTVTEERRAWAKDFMNQMEKKPREA